MANSNLSLAERERLAAIQRMHQAQAMQPNITGAQSDSPFVSNFAAAFNAGNGVVNAIRTADENRRLRADQEMYKRASEEALRRHLGLSGNNKIKLIFF